MTELGLVTGLAVIVVLLLGGGVTATALRASRRTRTDSRALGSLAIGLGVLTAAAGVGAGAHHLLGVPFARALLAQTLATAVGFGALLVSLYVEPRITGGTGRRGGGSGS